MLRFSEVKTHFLSARRSAMRWYALALAWPVLYFGGLLALLAINGDLTQQDSASRSSTWRIFALAPALLFLVPGAIGDRILAAARTPCPTCNRPLRSRDARWALQTGLCPGCRKPMIDVSRPRSPVAVARLEQRRQRRAGWVTLWSLPALGMTCSILVRLGEFGQDPRAIGSISFFPVIALTLGLYATISTRQLRYLAPSAFAAAVLVINLVVLS